MKIVRAQPKVPLHVIFIALIYVINLTRAAVANSREDLSESTTETTTTFLPCKLSSNSNLDCSNLKLSEIPKNIPNTTLSINLSYNSFQTFDDDAFDECCFNIKNLDLSYNEITNLSSRHFEKLKSLEVILLGSNKLTSLSPKTFQGLASLKHLNLSNNPLELPSQGAFLIQTSLEKLNLDNCDIEEIPDGTFANMTQLEELSLAGNPFDENLDSSVFEPLSKLIRLRTPNASKSSIYSLCEKLTAIDVINFDEYNVSCTVLSDDGPFDEAINPPDLPEPEIRSVMIPTTKETTTTTTVAPTTSISSTTTVPAMVPAVTTTSKPQENIETSDGSSNKSKFEPETAQIDIGNDTIKFILVGIFAATIIGILIGLICRADVCGIKTKMCRSKKNNNNRREATDTTVSPFEEIPLNSVNGKSTEGAG